MAYAAQMDRQKIAAAALDLLREKGLQGLSIRGVAARLQLAPNALYHYFGSKEELIVAVAAAVSGLLHDAFLKVCKRKRPEQAIRAMAQAYMDFARENPLLYEILVVPRPASGEDAVGPKGLWDYVVAQVARVSAKDASSECAVSLWAVVHGMAALQNAGAFNDEMPATSFGFAMDAWMAAARGTHSS